jgi:DNA repair protein RecN (Recombination protein N)
MLAELKVSNYALIEDLAISFSPGLNILSGETGAGKSIIIGAINLLLGERATVEQIRQGSEEAVIEGLINPEPAVEQQLNALLAEAGIEYDNELIIAREVFRNGRSVARVNGRAVPVSFLKGLGQLLVDLHGQHQHQSLLRQDQHIELLDAFGGETIWQSRRSINELWRRRSDLKKELSVYGDDNAERARRLDLNNFQLKEIQDADLKPGEDEELAEREKVLSNAEKLSTYVSRIYCSLYRGDESAEIESIVDRLGQNSALLSEAAGIDRKLAPLLELVASAAAQLEEVSHELRDYQSKFEFDPAELQMIQERSNLINNLKRKYGGSIEEVLSFATEVEKEIERLVNSEAMIEKIEAELVSLNDQLAFESETLSKKRAASANNLEQLIEECLQELALPNASFKVKISHRGEVGQLGFDNVEFLFSANRGEEVKPLAKIISGGEVARVMLALKTALARQDLIPTLIFDEVDSGIGGTTIQAVAEKLAGLAKHHQVMCVTHSPQIASMADAHIRLFKEVSGERTMTRATLLSENERRNELARMLDGASIDQVSLQHVENLIERASRFKQAREKMI